MPNVQTNLVGLGSLCSESCTIFHGKCLLSCKNEIKFKVIISHQGK